MSVAAFPPLYRAAIGLSVVTAFGQSLLLALVARDVLRMYVGGEAYCHATTLPV